ncbi:hypothetical protein PUN28_010681 [Cardiocondyla obscurior]|uniref:Uncharacterized protein n=1 Tax=Cardiocondyla obscurior TaxID=286306 RepID=A0AAW2FHJ8_9HYME
MGRLKVFVGGRGCFSTTPSSGLVRELWKRGGKLSDASRLSTIRAVGAAQRRDARQPARSSLRSTFRGEPRPSRAKPSVSGQSGGESPRCQVKKKIAASFSFRNMWCCKRLDASDWPVTTVVRGNISCLHVAATAASLTSETPLFSDAFSSLVEHLSNTSFDIACFLVSRLRPMERTRPS